MQASEILQLYKLNPVHGMKEKIIDIVVQLQKTPPVADWWKFI